MKLFASRGPSGELPSEYPSNGSKIETVWRLEMGRVGPYVKRGFVRNEKELERFSGYTHYVTSDEYTLMVLGDRIGWFRRWPYCKDDEWWVVIKDGT